MSDAHASFFGQSQPHTLPEGDGECATTRVENNPAGTNATYMSVGWTQQPEQPDSGQRGGGPDHEFRGDLVTRIERIIQDFREKKVAKIEALYQILRVAQEAEVEELVRQAAIDDYATQIDLIDAQQRSAEQRGEHAAQLARIGDGRAASREPDRDKSQRRDDR